MKNVFPLINVPPIQTSSYQCISFQIIFDAFSVGRFDEGLIDSDSDSSDNSLSSMGDLPGCPEGFMQVSSDLVGD